MPTNRLVHEKSPYLLQHAHNPVDWFPWGEEAFEKARREDKPIFLSVGYSTCHWCHVMERESFQNEEIAALLNRYFVPVKVDREERPDVDRIYMTFVQAVTGSGGWPMSVFLTPDLKPFFGGTYFPPDNRWGRPGFRYILERLAEAWISDRERVVHSGEQLLQELRRYVEIVPEPARLDASLLESGFFAFRRSFDSRYGGFGEAPKFPRPAALNFLLREYARTRNPEALEMTLATLEAMARGGIYDHLGGGFHRYSVDERWFVPHFEKMLYDQAQLAVSYLEAFQITGRPVLARVAREVLDYVLRDMTDPEGGFYSAEDADSVIDPSQPEVKGEGAFYVWRRDEIEAVLGRPAAEWFAYRYGVEEDGNVAHDPHGEFTGKNILYEARSIEETAHRFGRSAEAMAAALEQAKAALLAARNLRPRPHRDDKVLTSWNGLMISAFAVAARILGQTRYLEAARRAAEFVLTRMYDSRAGTLLRRYREGEAAIPAFLDDYAFFAQALLDLYEACFDVRYLEQALELTERMRELFEDRRHGAFFSTAEGDSSLVLRMKDDYDGAEPSGNSIAALNLLRLAAITDRADLRQSAERTLEAFASRMRLAPSGVPQMLVALGWLLATPRQVVIAGPRDDTRTQALLRVVEQRFLPYKVVLLAGEESQPRLAQWQPAIAAMRARQGKPTAYVCENFVCRAPVTEPDELARLLE
ncbi:MAG: thioredoxin domain-containing protein [Bryobacterales bacterium]|nr:thioredoxin domain-containing protein [Bryobacteraceae bacterium]MDW8354321.1 thioredoxin domain-containing protein [Bryobacterales bacterium]